MKKTITLLTLSIFLFTSCAVKDDDNLATKAVKHTVMTPIYVGEALDKGAKLAVIVPLALVASLFKPDFPDIAKGERKYKKLEQYKSFAVAIDSKELSVFGYSRPQKTQEEANKIALETCEQYRGYNDVKAQCVLYLIGDEKQLELATLLPEETKQVNNETQPIQNIE